MLWISSGPGIQGSLCPEGPTAPRWPIEPVGSIALLKSYIINYSTASIFFLAAVAI
jgi:hypothetical protein